MNFNIENLNFNSSGLIPAIAQCSETKDVLMLAWMNKESIRLTIETKNYGLKVKQVEIINISKI